MTFEEMVRAAAQTAVAEVEDVIRSYRSGRLKHEDDITGALVGQLRAAFRFKTIGGLHWDASILTHRSGRGGEEKKFGADLLIHVKLDTPTQKYSKGILVQAKRTEPETTLWTADHNDLVAQCGKMLSVTAAAFIF